VLKNSLVPYDGWITGRKRYHENKRAELEFFEYDKSNDKFKINPLAHWRVEDVTDYFAANNLPPHPLVSKGYPSIGCKPCTVPVGTNDDVRSGRWQGCAKTECGIHFETKSLTPAEDMT
jgi:phosphoadenosine phosphosulfate reductase